MSCLMTWDLTSEVDKVTQVYDFVQELFPGQNTCLSAPWTSFCGVQAQIPQVFLVYTPLLWRWRRKSWNYGGWRELWTDFSPDCPFISVFQSIISLPVCHSDAIHIPESFSRRSFLDQNLSWTSFAVCQIQNFS